MRVTPDRSPNERCDALNAGARCILLSGKRLTEEDRREIFDLGAEIMPKPFMPQKLVEKVGELLG